MFNEHAGELVELDGRALIKTRPGKSGCAVFGPYETLAPGKYRVDFYIKPLGNPRDERDPLCATVDIIANLNVKLFDALVFWSQIEPDGKFSVWFEIDQWLNWIEYRLFVNGVEPLLLGDAPSAILVGETEAPPPRALPPLFVEQEVCIRSLFDAGVGVAAFQHSLVVTVAAAQWRLETRDDFAIVDEIISKNNFSIMYPTPVCSTVSEGEPRKADAQIVVLGTCTAYGHFGFALLGTVMDALHGEHRRIHCQSLAELRACWGEQKGKPVLITSDSPDTALSYLLTTSGFPVLAFFDDPATALADATRSRGLELPDAIRFCSRYFSCLAGCAGSKNITVFGSQFYHATLAELVDAVCLAVLGEVNATVSARAMQRLVEQEGLAADATVEEALRCRLQGQSPTAFSSAQLNAASRSLVDWFVTDYGPMLTGAESEIEWPREIFCTGAKGETAEAEVKLVGGRRFLLWGPYLNLPFGAWRLSVKFEVVDNLSGNELETDIFSPNTQAQLARCVVKLPALGHFQFSLDFMNADPSSPLEMRIVLLRGAIEGHFALRQVTLQPIAGAGELVTITPAAVAKHTEATTSRTHANRPDVVVRLPA